jgi:hypothetical protein
VWRAGLGIKIKARVKVRFYVFKIGYALISALVRIKTKA